MVPFSGGEAWMTLSPEACAALDEAFFSRGDTCVFTEGDQRHHAYLVEGKVGWLPLPLGYLSGCGCLACLWLRLACLSLAAVGLPVSGCGWLACLWLRLASLSLAATGLLVPGCG